MFSKKSLIPLLFACISAAPMAHAASVSLGSEFEGGVFGRFDVSYQAGAPGLKLQAVTFDLKSPLFLDPTFAGPGVLLPLPFSFLTGAASTGFLGIMGANDGGTSFSLLFNDFDAGENFGFDLDVDSPCNNLLCQLAGSLTTGAEFAGTKITGVLGGEGYLSTSLEGEFVRTGHNSAAAYVQGEAPEVPEPATMGLLGLSLSGVLFGSKFLRRRA